MSNWSGWTCDELTPALCPLECDQGHLIVRGVQIHYWIYYYASSSSPASAYTTSSSPLSLPPLIVVHGGPGLPHDYLLPLRQPACLGRAVIFYDQVGTGESAIDNDESNNMTITESHPWLLDPWYYATEELPALVEHLKIKQYHLIGHSWGTLVAQLHALDANVTQKLLSVILWGPLSDMRLWEQALWDLGKGIFGTLPPFVQHKLQYWRSIMNDDDLQENLQDSPEYIAMHQAMRERFLCRTVPLPDCYHASYERVQSEIFTAFRGPSEFANGGLLAHFNITGRLHELQWLPVMLGAGTFDIVRPTVVQTMYQELRLSEWVVFNKSGHVSAIDEPGRTNSLTVDFMQRVETSMPFLPERSSSPNNAMNDDSCLASYWDDFWSSSPLILTFVMSLVLGFAIARGILMRKRQGYRSLV